VPELERRAVDFYHLILDARMALVTFASPASALADVDDIT
jgi:hypothetical protein